MLAMPSLEGLDVGNRGREMIPVTDSTRVE